MCLFVVDNEGDFVFFIFIVKLFLVFKYILIVVEVLFINWYL